MAQPRIGVLGSPDIVPRSFSPQQSCCHRVFHACYSRCHPKATAQSRNSITSRQSFTAGRRSRGWRQAKPSHAGLEPFAGSEAQSRAEVRSMISFDRRTILRLLAVLIASSSVQPLAGQAAGAMQGQRAFGISNDRFTVNGEPVRLLAGE